MEWEGLGENGAGWLQKIGNRSEKEELARQVVEKVKDGQVIGVGSGSTAYLALQLLAEKVRQEALHIWVIPASREMSMNCVRLGLQQVSLWEKKPDWCFDGADEVDPRLNLIKGRGGALFKEKLLICSSPCVYILADQTKLVSRLGAQFPVPIEIFPWAYSYVCQQIRQWGATEIRLRPAGGKDGPVITENGNFLLDVRFPEIHDNLEKQLKEIPGVIESGLFIHYPVILLTIPLGKGKKE